MAERIFNDPAVRPFKDSSEVKWKGATKHLGFIVMCSWFYHDRDARKWFVLVRPIIDDASFPEVHAANNFELVKEPADPAQTEFVGKYKIGDVVVFGDSDRKYTICGYYLPTNKSTPQYFIGEPSPGVNSLTVQEDAISLWREPPVPPRPGLYFARLKHTGRAWQICRYDPIRTYPWIMLRENGLEPSAFRLSQITEIGQEVIEPS